MIDSFHDWFWSEVGEWTKGKELELDEELICVSTNYVSLTILNFLGLGSVWQTQIYRLFFKNVCGLSFSSPNYPLSFFSVPTLLYVFFLFHKYEL